MDNGANDRADNTGVGRDNRADNGANDSKCSNDGSDERDDADTLLRCVALLRDVVDNINNGANDSTDNIYTGSNNSTNSRADNIAHNINNGANNIPNYCFYIRKSIPS